jgi:hypothetical protein
VVEAVAVERSGARLAAVGIPVLDRRVAASRYADRVRRRCLGLIDVLQGDGVVPAVPEVI